MTYEGLKLSSIQPELESFIIHSLLIHQLYPTAEDLIEDQLLVELIMTALISP